MRTLTLLLSTVLVTACQPAQRSEQAAEGSAPARPSTSGPPSATTPAPPAYVGQWAADLTWCRNTLGPERPLVVTATEFQGYENTCQIVDLAEAGERWTANFVCQGEGTTTRQPVTMTADGEELKIRWVDEGYDVTWRRCPA